GENIASIDIDPLIADGYIPVATADELDKLRENKKQTFGAGTKWESEYESGLDKKYVQVADIDLSHFDTWEPIGSGSSRFSGDYNGLGYLITDLKVDQENDYAGLFGRADGATFKNIRLENVEISGRNYVGSLVGSQLE